MRQTPLTLRRWTRGEYDRLVDAGLLHDEPLELIGGQLVVAEPQGSYHSSRIGQPAMNCDRTPPPRAPDRP